MTYTLVLLGTDTNFSPNPVRDAYDKAETLSYVASLIEGTPYATDEVVQYRNSNVAVIAGPTTLGVEVGDRIARGVLAILEAISRGETDISIIAHSRGAVEAILIAHELERIQKLLAESTYTLPEIINSECKYTKTAMNGRHLADYAALNLGKIAEHIGNVKISTLDIDPVPGGNLLGVTRIGPVAWRDPRYYIISKLVTEFELYIYENERTRGFKPIIPKCASAETIFKLMGLPGHHGTGEGNLLDQQRKAIPLDGSTEHVQALMVLKIIDFLTRQGVQITPRTTDDPFAPMLATIFKDNVLQRQELNKLYFNLYNEIVKNLPLYQHFNKTSYQLLGQEQGVVRLVMSVEEQRIVHYHAHTDTFLDTIIPPLAGGHFLNHEHARLYLEHEFDSKNRPLNETIDYSIDQLIKVCEHPGMGNKSITDEFEVLDYSDHSEKIIPALLNKEGFEILLSALGMLIEEVRSPYLRNEFTQEQRVALYASVSRAFTLFQRFITAHPENELAKSILNTLNTNLTTTLQTKHAALTDQYKKLSLKLIEKEKTFNTLFEKLDAIIITATPSLKQQLEFLLQEAIKLNKANASSKYIRESIEKACRSLNDLEVPDELSKNIIDSVKLLMNEAIEESINYNSENIIQEFIEFVNKLDEAKEVIPKFKTLYAELDYDAWEEELKNERTHIVSLAAQYIVQEELNLQRHVKPLFKENDVLYKEIEEIARGELPCQSLKKKLIPLTKKYLTYLATKIAKSRAIEIDRADPSVLIENVQMIQNWPQDQSSKALKQKFDAVSDLYKTLMSGKELKASEKIVQFYQKLNTVNEVLQTHRDKKWKRYVSNALTLLAILLTGILPGLVLLALRSVVNGRSPKFWQSTGQTFFEKSANKIENTLSLRAQTSAAKT